MSDTKEITAPELNLTSKAFPTEGDMATWKMLTPSQQRAWLIAEEDKGFKSGAAPHETLEERLSRVRAEIS